MAIGPISMRYAKALIKYAQNQKKDDVVYGEMLMLSQSLLGNQRLKDVLNSPVLPRADKQKLLITAAVGNEPASEELKRFVKLVIDRRRESYIHFIAMTYLDLYRKSKNIGTARLTTAVPIDKATRDRVHSASTKQMKSEVELETIVDPSIEGGFIFDVDGYRLDASIATQLKRVKQQFIDKNRRIV